MRCFPIKETLMGKCDACGNHYDKSFDVTIQGKTYTFDSFECAIHSVAPRCEHCAVPIIGHGLERAAACSAATIALPTKASQNCVIDLIEELNPINRS